MVNTSRHRPDSLANAVSRRARPTHDWSNDEFAAGAYPSQASEDGYHERLGAPVYWAGGITDTVHTSFTSGRHAAAGLLRGR